MWITGGLARYVHLQEIKILLMKKTILISLLMQLFFYMLIFIIASW